MADVSPYVVLGILPDASPEEIRAAFRRALRQRHPDTAPSVTDDTAVRGVIDAYRLLADPGARARYDAAHAPPDAGDRGPGRVQARTASAPRGTSSTGRALCVDCDGAGIVRQIVACPTCHGRAEITTLEATRARVLRCGTCRGSGRIRSRQVCGRCDGKGFTATPP